jgi:pseudomonalisin
VFHDVKTGNNSVPGVTGFSAVAGYDLATGLGSVDADVLVNHWKDAAGAAAFHLSLLSSAVSVVRGGASAKVTARISLSGGFDAPVTLTVKGLPAGVTATLVPASLAAPGAGTSVLTLTSTAKAGPGRYTATVSAVGSGVAQNAVVSLTVN